MAAASLQILKSTLLTPVSVSHSNFRGKSDSSGKVLLRFRSYKWSRCFLSRKFRVCCSVQDGDNNQTNGEEPPESLFMKELKRRGMTPTSLLEDTNRTDYGLDDEAKLREEDRSFSKRNAVSTELDKSLSDQRERSMALNSEGLEHEKHQCLLGRSFTNFACLDPVTHYCKEKRNKSSSSSLVKGLIPRAKLLLTLGGTFFFGFWPLILITVAFFSALYLYFGATFVHDGSQSSVLPPQYVDPYELLEDERISQIAPRVN